MITLASVFSYIILSASVGLGCSSNANSVLLFEIIEKESLLEHVRRVSPHFQKRLHQLRKLPIVVDTRGLGLIGCVEGRIIDPSCPEALSLDHKLGARIDKHCQALGLIVRPLLNMCVFSPPLIITMEQIDQMFEILEQGILRASEDLQEEGLWKG